MTGDIEEDVQRLMVSWGTGLRSELLKVPHHGAQGLQEKFTEAVNPEVTFISCGVRNRYGHPAETTISTLKQSGSKVWRTDLDGTIMVTLPSMTVSTY